MSAMDVKIAKWAEKLGYTIAGFSQDLYEGAEFIYLPSYMAGDEPTEEELRHSVRGKVLEIRSKMDASRHDRCRNQIIDHYVIHFVYVTEDGTQVSETYCAGLGLRFKDNCPEVKPKPLVFDINTPDPELERLLDEEEEIARRTRAGHAISPPVNGVFYHKCKADGCQINVPYDDEPYCFTHSPDEGSSVKGYSAYQEALDNYVV